MIFTTRTKLIFTCLFLLTLVVMLATTVIISIQEKQFIDKTNAMVEETNQKITNEINKLSLPPTPTPAIERFIK